MAAVPASTVRSRIAAALEALTGWRESRWAPGLFGRDPQTVMHLSFAVAMRGMGTPEAQRQRLNAGAFILSAVEIPWAHKLRGDSQVADYASALDQEAAAIRAVCAVATTDGMQVLYRTSRRDDSTTEGFILGTITFDVYHRIDLQ